MDSEKLQLDTGDHDRLRSVVDDETTSTGQGAARPAWRLGRQRRGLRRSRALRLLVMGCLMFIVYAQWRQLRPGCDYGGAGGPGRKPASSPVSPLSLDQLRIDVATCAVLRRKPRDPAGEGRERNARWVEGGKPTLIRNATVWTGDPAAGTSSEDARRGAGFSWRDNTDVFLERGLIAQVGSNIDVASLPDDTLVYDARGRQLTAGIIDMHSHAGVDSLPELNGNEDDNEVSSDTTPYVRSIDGLQPLDAQIQVIKSGGVTTSLVLPGSANNIGGEAYVIKHAVGKRNHRPEISAVDMLADPDREWRYMKMACGENPKRVYGKTGVRGPASRLGESWEFRHAFARARSYVRAQDDWCDEVDRVGVENVKEYLPRELALEALGAVFRGQVLVNTHCYTIPDLEAFVDHTKEFNFSVRAFHHAHQTYLVPEILKRAYGDTPPASALFADNMFYKAEAAVASEFAGKTLWEDGLDPIYVSDNPVLNAQHVLFEAAKAYGYGLPYHAALAAVTSTPARYLGLGERIGRVKPGFDADVVVWDSDPLSVGAAPVQVWIDGQAQYEEPVRLEKPLRGPIIPDPELARRSEREDAVVGDVVVFTGVKKVLLSGDVDPHADATDADPVEPINLVVSGGNIACLGPCTEEVRAARQSVSTKVVQLQDGYVTSAFTAFGSLIGLNAIDAEKVTDNGPTTDAFSRGVDGLALDTAKLQAAHRYGVTRAISAPKLGGGFSHHGTSVGFATGAKTPLAKGAIWADDVAVHYTLTPDSKGGKTPSFSAVVGALRTALLDAVSGSNGDDLARAEKKSSASEKFAEKHFLARVVEGKTPLAITAHSADAIAAVLRVKADVEAALAANSNSRKKQRIRLVILGGAEAHLLAPQLAASDVGVVLAPLQSYCVTWDQRRCLTGAPLTNGTAIDVLTREGVTVAIGLEEDWLVRDMGLLAGIAHRNSGGRIGEKQALALVSRNVYTMLGLQDAKAAEENADGEHFVVWEGSPLEIGGRVRGVAGGLGLMTVLE